MKKCIIIGLGSFAELMYYYLTTFGSQEIVAFSVNEKYITEKDMSFQGLPVVPLELLNERFPPEEYEVFMGVGYSGMNSVRCTLFQACKEMGYAIGSFIHPSCIIAPNAVLGEGNILLEGSIVQPSVTMGDGNIVWYQVKIAHDDKIGNFNTLAGNTSLSGFVTVEDNCFLGNACVVLEKRRIASRTLIGAGAIVKWDTAPDSVIVPAKSVVLKDCKSTDFI